MKKSIRAAILFLMVIVFATTSIAGTGVTVSASDYVEDSYDIEIQETTEDDETDEEDSEEVIIISDDESSDSASDYEESSDSGDEAELEDINVTAATSGQCGANVTWRYSWLTRRLSIYGTGAMYDYSSKEATPWNEYAGSILCIVIDEGVTRIGNHAFEGIGKPATSSRGLNTVIFASSVKEIGDYAFKDVEIDMSVKEFVIPDTVTTLGKGAFYHFVLDPAGANSTGTELGTLVIGNGIKVIPEDCFRYAVAPILKLPAYLEKIEKNAFNSFYGGETIEFPASLKSIEDYGCYFENLDFQTRYFGTMVFNGNMPKLGEGAFKNHISVVYYPAGNSTYTEAAITEAGKAFYHAAFRQKGYSVTHKAGDNITWQIKSYADSSWTVNELVLTGSGPMYDYSDNKLPEWYDSRQKINKITIDPRITSIGDYAFTGIASTYVKNYEKEVFKLPSRLTKVGEHAFSRVNVGMTELPTYVEYIGDYGFYGIRMSTTNVFPSGVKHIGNYAFYCSNLALNVNWGSVEYIGDCAFFRVENMKMNATFPSTLKYIGRYAFANDKTSISGKLVIPDSVTEVGASAFSLCHSLTGDVKLMGVSSLENYVFSSTGITSVTFGEKLAKIDCGRNSMQFPSTVKTVTFNNRYFDDIDNLLWGLNGNNPQTTVYYPGGKGWNIKTSTYKYINFVQFGSCSVTFVYPDGTEVVKTTEVGKPISKPADPQMADGVTLVGWYRKKEFITAEKWDFSAPVSSDMRLYAMTSADKCKVIFNYPRQNGAINDTANYTFTVESVTYGKNVPVRRFEKTGARLIGWYLDAAFTKPADLEKPVTENLNLYSKWKAVEIIDLSTYSKVSYDKNVTFEYGRKPSKYAPVVKIDYGEGAGWEKLQEYYDYTIDWGNFIRYQFRQNVGDYTVKIVGKGNFKGELTFTIHITQLDLSKDYVGAPSEKTYVYFDREHKDEFRSLWCHLPAPEEKGCVYLDLNEDYTIEYYRNGKKCDEIKDAGTYTIKYIGIGNCKGSRETKAVVTPFSLNTGNVSKSTYISLEYNGEIQKHVPYITCDLDNRKRALKENKDYTLTYVDEDKEGAFKDPGTYTIKVKGIGNYKDEFTIIERITAQDTDSKSLADAVITGNKAVTYKGVDTPPSSELVVKYKGKTLKKGVHYKLTYNKASGAGSAKAKIEAIAGSGFKGSIEFIYKIKPADFTKTKISGLKGDIAMDYTGRDIVLNGYEIQYPFKSGSVSLKGCELSKYNTLSDSAKAGYSFTYEYKNNVNAGKSAKVIFRGVNNYTGSKSKTFSIKRAVINEAAVLAGTIIIECPELIGLNKSPKAAVYTKGKTVLSPKVYFKPDGKSEKILLTEKKDYKISYENNTKVADGSGKKAPAITITGMGNFKGSFSGKFTIKASAIENCTVSAKDVKYKKGADNYKTTITVRDSNGAKLKAGTDYDVKNITYINASTGKQIAPKEHVAAGTEIKVVIQGKGNYASKKTISCKYKIVG